MRILSLLFPPGKLLAAFPLLRVKLVRNLSTLTVNSPNFKSLLTPHLLSLESLFKSEGHDLRLTGGVVRDLLLRQTPVDVDIATDCTPDEMIKLFEANGICYYPTGLDHGTVTVHFDPDIDYEVTTLRIDRITDGRRAVVDFTKDWFTDAQRRDFTINAMSLSLDGTLYDYFNGLKHLDEKKVVFVGNARARIKEDYLRILRYFRFYGRITPEVDQHDSETLQVIQETAQGLKGVSVERVWMELRRILPGNHAPHLVRLMYKLGVADSIELPPDGNLEELENVWSTMKGRNSLHLIKPFTLLVTLVHTVEEVQHLTQAWKLSRRKYRLGAFLARHREKLCRPDVPIKQYQDLLVDGVPDSFVAQLLYYCGKIEMAAELSKWKVPKMPVNGEDLKKKFEIPRGKEIGYLLAHLKMEWKESYYVMDKEELLDFANKIRNEVNIELKQNAF